MCPSLGYRGGKRGILTNFVIVADFGAPKIELDVGVKNSFLNHSKAH